MRKHLKLNQRILIEDKSTNNYSLRKIGDFINKPHTTISREILSRRILVKGNTFNSLNMKCEITEKASYICNGCPIKNKCIKYKYFYIS